ncbi:Por secretion system C-terminal sorting domain-containing protein [Reichenbachiella agariperforans]|uniref:Por secretion system C-terminal sorting domain-containing protein n=1 Tax=Reichenbachiella agariperforans TaxID=156994 RepID=A0A1M6S107_REIAG|nr:glycosyl hydrolase [Reichenbachiella agariperforans]SHK38360.1 Por secretion system C-terminal sorting domain-containing protein [Reichenbachiella agariperforans]
MKALKLFIALIPLCLTLNAQTPFESLNYLYSIQGTKTIGGMHNRQPNANPNGYSQQLNGIIGQWPGLYSADFQFEPNEIANRQTMIDQAIQEWNNGAMVNIMWHACNPAKGEPCYWDSNGVLSQMSQWEWDQLLTDGTAINNSWKSRMDDVAYYLQQLEDAGVEVFFRPLHEMNQGMFWWGGRPGANGTARLYQITHDYMTNTKGLSNLIWVWNMQDYSGLANDLYNYDPGWNYWDVLTMDMYWSDGQGYSTAKYNAMVAKAGGRPIGIGECEDLPAVNLLNNQPLWTFFMGWSELTFSANSNQKIQDIYWSSRVLTLNEMPGWNGTGTWQNGGSGGGGTQYIQAEDYDNMSGVQTETTSDPGGGNLNVGWIDNGDWMTYNSITVPSSGAYTIAYRVASSAGGTIQFEQAGGASYGSVAVPSTGGYQSWTTIYQTVNLSAGTQNFGIKALTGGWNINWWSLTPNSGARRAEKTDLTLELGAYPNPFSDQVRIPVVGEGDFELSIYDMSGSELRRFTAADRRDAQDFIVWKGLDSHGAAIAPGIYHFRLVSATQILSGKLLKEK